MRSPSRRPAASPRRRSGAFTLLEVVVVLVVLGILAAIAVVTFQKVIVRSQDEAALVELAALQRDAWAVAASDSTASYSLPLFVDNYSSAAGLPGVSAGPAGLGLTWATQDGRASESAQRDGTGPSTAHGLVSVAVGSPDPVNVYMAMRSKSGNCVYHAAAGSSKTTSKIITDRDVPCRASADGELPKPVEKVSVPVLSASQGSGGNLLSWTDSIPAVSYCVWAGPDRDHLKVVAPGAVDSDPSTPTITWVHSEATVDQAWTYQVTACPSAAGSEGPKSNLASVVPSSWAPTLSGHGTPYQANLSIDPTVTTTNADGTNFGWTLKVLSYQVLRRPDASSPWAQIGTVTRPDPASSSPDVYVDTMVTPGVAYDYRAVPVLDSGVATANASNVQNVLVPLPPKPVLAAWSEDTTGRLTWGAVQGATGYTVARDGVNVGSVDGSTTSFSDPGLAYSTTYTYTVTAAVGGVTTASNPAAITTGASSSAAVLTVSRGTGSTWRTANLSWTKLSGYTSGYVYFRAQGAASWSAYTSTTGTTMSIVLPAGSTYQFYVQQTATVSGPTNVAALQIPDNVAPVLSVARGTVETSSDWRTAKLSWNAPQDYSSGYVYFRQKGAASWSAYTSTTGTTMEIVLTAGLTYEFYVNASYQSGASKSTNTVSLTVPQNVAPVLSVTRGTVETTSDWRTAKLSWTKPRDYSSGYVYFRQKGATSWSAYTSTTGTTMDIVLTAGLTYEFYVNASYQTGASKATNTAELTIPGNAASTLSVTRGTDDTTSDWRTAKLSWTKPRDYSAGYVYFRQKGATSWSYYTSTTGTTMDIVLTAGLTYEFYVNVTYQTGASKATNTVELTIPGNAASTLSVTRGTVETTSDWRTAKLSWTKPRDYSAGYVYFRQKGATSWSYYTSTTGTTMDIVLTAGLTYEFYVNVTYQTGASTNTNTVELTIPENVAPVLSGALGTTDADWRTAYLSWTKPRDYSAGYVYFRQKGATSWSYYTSTTGTTMSISLTAGLTYEFYVNASYQTGASKNSNVLELSVPDNTAPTLYVTLGDSKLNFSDHYASYHWSVPRDASTVYKYYRVKGSSSWIYWTSQTAAGGTEPDGTSLQLQHGQTYEFYVNMSYLTGASKNSNVYTLTVPDMDPPVLTGVSLSSTGVASVGWNPTTEAGQTYTVYVSRAPKGTTSWSSYSSYGSFSGTALDNPDGAYYNGASVTVGPDYDVRVYVVATASYSAKSAQSNTVSASAP